MKFAFAVALGIAGLVGATAANAATGTVVSANGKAVVERAGQTVSVKEGMALNDGDMIVVKGEGSVVVSYAGLCRATVGTGAALVGPTLCPPTTTGADLGRPAPVAAEYVAPASTEVGYMPILLAAGGGALVGGVIGYAIKDDDCNCHGISN